MPEDVEGVPEENKGNMASNDTYDEHKKSNKTGWVLLVFKIIELILCIVCVGCLSDPAQSTFQRIRPQFHHITLAYSTFVSYIIINSVVIIGKVLGEQVGLRTSLLLSFIGSALFFVTSILLFVDHPNLSSYIFYPRDYEKNLWAASAAMALINAIVFVGETILTFLKREDFD